MKFRGCKSHRFLIVQLAHSNQCAVSVQSISSDQYVIILNRQYAVVVSQPSARNRQHAVIAAFNMQSKLRGAHNMGVQLEIAQTKHP